MKVRLGDYIKEYSVRNKSGEDIPVYSVTNIQGFCKDYFGKDVSSKDRTTYKIVPMGYFAYNPSRINVGSVDWQRYENKVIVSPLYNVFSVSPELEQQYLYYYLKSDIGLFYIKAAATGSVRDNLKLAMLYEFKINLPSIEEQRSIVKKLDGLKKIIELYKQQLQTLDDLVKARFVEMFGNQSNNEKGFTYGKIADVADIYLGLTHTPKYIERGVKFISAKNISADYLDLSEVKYISAEEYASAPEGAKPRRGDMLFSRVGSNLGHPVIIDIDEELCTFVSLGFLRSKDSITTLYLKHWMRDSFFAEQVKRKVIGGGQPNLNTGWLKEFSIIIPPITLQNEFAEFVQEVDKSKVVVQKALDEAQTLFDSLMQQYFG